MQRLLGIACVGIVALLAMPAMADHTYAGWLDGVNRSAGFLVDYQNDDGGWTWQMEPANHNPAHASPGNTIGATARGLVKSYLVTGNSSYIGAANKAANLLTTNNVFYNKDIEFAHELAAAGGVDVTAQANAYAINYINQKIANLNVSGAQAVHDTYTTSGWASPGAQMWMLGEWAHVGMLLGDAEIHAGYTGNDFAAELSGLVEADYGTYFDPTNDTYSIIGMVGTLEGTYWTDGTAGTTDALADLKAALADGTGFGYQSMGYTTYILSLLNDPMATMGSKILLDWMTPEGGWLYGADWYSEPHGEALLGLVNTPVPAPGALLLGALGLSFTAWIRKS